MKRNNVLMQARKRKARSLAQSGRLDEARALCAQLCRTAGRDPEPWFMLGALNGQVGLYEESIECCRQAIARHPDHVDAHYNLAQAYLHCHRVEAAAAEFRRVVELRPDHVEAHANLGYALELLDGGAMSGLVLTRYAPREIALAGSEIDGVAARRVFSVARGATVVGVNMMSWGRPDEELEPVARALGRAVDRLVIALGGASASA